MTIIAYTNFDYKKNELEFFGEELKDDYETVIVGVKKKQNKLTQFHLLDAKLVNSFTQEVAKEVKPLLKKKQKKFYRLLQATSATLLSLILVTNKANAQIPKSTDVLIGKKNNIITIENEEGLGILSPELAEILHQLLEGAKYVGIRLAILLFFIAAVYIMLGKKVKGSNWITEIIKGLAIILLAPTLVLLLVSLVSLLLNGLDGLDIFF